MTPKDSRWQPTIDLLVRLGGSEPTLQPDGSWSVGCDVVEASYAAILAEAPGRFVREDEHSSWMLDHAGDEVEVEMTYTLLSCAGERALLSWSEHWQAGGSGTLTVYATREAYEQGLAEAKAWIAENRSFDLEMRADFDDEPW